MVMQNYRKKVTFSKKYLPLKRFLFWKNSCSEQQNKYHFEKVLTLNNYLLWRKRSSETVVMLQKYLSSRSSWLEKVLLPRSTYKKKAAAPDNQVFWKNFSAKIYHFILIKFDNKFVSRWLVFWNTVINIELVELNRCKF